MYLTRRASRSRNHRRPRAVEFIEFAIILPFMLFFITFSVDMGHLAMIQSVLQNATQQVARGGAQNGGWDFVDPTYCSTGNGLCTQQSAPYKLMYQSLGEIPLVDPTNLDNLYSFVSPDGLTNGGPPGYCTNGSAPGADEYVVAKSTYDASHIFLTPFLYNIMGVALDKYNWTLHATAVARVDVCH